MFSPTVNSAAVDCFLECVGEREVLWLDAEHSAHNSWILMLDDQAEKEKKNRGDPVNEATN